MRMAAKCQMHQAGKPMNIDFLTISGLLAALLTAICLVLVLLPCANHWRRHWKVWGRAWRRKAVAQR